MISKSVKAALLEADKKQIDLAAVLDMSKQTMSNKMALDRWKGEDLLKVADLTGSRLAFVFPNGKIVEIEK